LTYPVMLLSFRVLFITFNVKACAVPVTEVTKTSPRQVTDNVILLVAHAQLLKIVNLGENS